MVPLQANVMPRLSKREMVQHKREWPEEYYPGYCLGNDYMMAIGWVKKIYNVRNDG